MRDFWRALDAVPSTPMLQAAPSGQSRGPQVSRSAASMSTDPGLASASGEYHNVGVARQAASQS